MAKKRASDDDMAVFCDDELCVEVPAYLRRQKGMLLFKAPKKTFPDRCLNLVCFLVETPEVHLLGFDGWQNNVVRHRHFDGIDTTLVRIGPVEWIKGAFESGGFESLYHYTSAGTDCEIAWDYGVKFGVSPGKLVEARFHGHGDQSAFEAVCRKMLLAVKSKVS